MLEKIREYVDIAKQFVDTDGHKYAAIEGNQDCNRGCSYCAVPAHYDRASELTVGETFQAIDWLHDQGYRTLSYLGGEPIAPFETKEGITFFDQTLQVIEHAKSRGMFVNTTSNGDFINTKNPEKLRLLKEAGLDSLTLTLHTYGLRPLQHLIDSARSAAELRIIPVIQTVMTSETAEKLPSIAAEAARNGILFGFGLVQTHGDGFSTEQEDSVIPSVTQQERIFRALLALKTYGFVRNNRNYLTKASNYHPNSWVCDPERDTFIKIGAGGKLNVCSSVETGLSFQDVDGLDDPEWRKRKREGVGNCEGCLFHCYYETQNPDLIGDLPSMALGLAIKNGQSKRVRALGEIATRNAAKKVPNVTWDLKEALTQRFRPLQIQE